MTIPLPLPLPLTIPLPLPLTLPSPSLLPLTLPLPLTLTLPLLLPSPSLSPLTLPFFVMKIIYCETQSRCLLCIGYLKCLSHQNGFLLIRIEQKKLLNKFFLRFCFKLLVPELQRLKVTIFAIF